MALKSKTVFVVGAGASCEVGLPSGHDLKKKIATLLDIRFPDGDIQTRGDRQIFEALRQKTQVAGRARGDIDSYLRKCWQISEVVASAALSIDNYLDAHSGDEALELCGKLGIARAILESESKSKLALLRRDGYAPQPFSMAAVENTWFVRLMNLLTEGVHKREVEGLFSNATFVIFNYDRCVETFLVRILTEYYGLSDADSCSIVNKARIYHPYGQVGLLPWQGGRDKVAFGQSSHVDLVSVAGRLKTFTERVEEPDLLTPMRKDIVEAESLIFLGFAYHAQNLELLRPRAKTAIGKIFGTRMGVSGADLEIIEAELKKIFEHYGGPSVTRLRFLDGTCSELFTEHWRGLAA